MIALLWAFGVGGWGPFWFVWGALGALFFGGAAMFFIFMLGNAVARWVVLRDYPVNWTLDRAMAAHKRKVA